MQLNELDYNMYVRAVEKADYPLILWSPADNENCQLSFESLDGLKNLHPEFEKNSKYFPKYNGPLFKSSVLGNFQLLQSFPGVNTAKQLPDEINKIFGQKRKYSGAFPPIK